jgi:ribonuclease HI
MRRRGEQQSGGDNVTLKAREIYCDGAAEPNPGPIGWGVFIPDELRFSIPGGYGTNQQAELRAVIEALKLAEPGDVILSDSQYAINVTTRKWKAKANLELIAEARNLYESKPGVTIKWIRGHSGHQHQERADLLANVAAHSQMTRRFFDRAA